MKKHKKPEWIDKHNILVQDIIVVGLWLVVKFLMLMVIILYPFMCMCHNKDEINEIIKELWGLPKFEDG